MSTNSTWIRQARVDLGQLLEFGSGGSSEFVAYVIYGPDFGSFWGANAHYWTDRQPKPLDAERETLTDET